MNHDTTKDPRLQVAQMACILLKKCSKMKPGVSLRSSKDKVSELVSACESSVMALTYSYLDPETLILSESMQHLTSTTNALSEAYTPLIEKRGDRSELRSNVRWCLRIFNGLKNRLTRSGTTMASGVDLVVVQVKDVERGKGFLKTRVTDGDTDYTVVTNMTSVEKNDKLAVAFLPPREIFGSVSEAMYLGSEKRSEAPGALISDTDVDTRDAAAILYKQDR